MDTWPSPAAASSLYLLSVLLEHSVELREGEQSLNVVFSNSKRRFLHITALNKSKCDRFSGMSVLK